MCVFCKGYLVPGTTEHIEKIENHVILIKDVPCEKCAQCGEALFSTSTVKLIESILDGIHRIPSEISLTVIDYMKSVA